MSDLKRYKTIPSKDAGIYKKYFLKKFDRDYSSSQREQLMPIVKKYIDRVDLREELEDEGLSKYANDLLERHGVSNKKAVVIVAQDNDPVFTLARGALVYDLIQDFLIILQRDFVKNYSADAVKALICHEVGHVVENHQPLRVYLAYNILKLNWMGILFAFFAALQIAGLTSFWSFFPFELWRVATSGDWSLMGKWFLAFYVPVLLVPHISNLLIFYWYQNQEFECDAFAVRELGKQPVVDLVKALRELAPAAVGFWSVLRNRFFAVHPSYSRRLDAIEALK